MRPADRPERYYGLAQLAMHHREHIVILRPSARGLLAHTMFYADEVRQEDECRADSRLVRDKELELARLLIRAGVTEFQPQKYHDTSRANPQKLIESKMAGQQFQVASGAPRAPVIDILEALKRSLEVVKKPIRTPGTSPASPDVVSKVMPSTADQPGLEPPMQRHSTGAAIPVKRAARVRNTGSPARRVGGHRK